MEGKEEGHFSQTGPLSVVKNQGMPGEQSLAVYSHLIVTKAHGSFKKRIKSTPRTFSNMVCSYYCYILEIIALFQAKK
jgi:hypothetical protein